MKPTRPQTPIPGGLPPALLSSLLTPSHSPRDLPFPPEPCCAISNRRPVLCRQHPLALGHPCHCRPPHPAISPLSPSILFRSGAPHPKLPALPSSQAASTDRSPSRPLSPSPGADMFGCSLIDDILSHIRSSIPNVKIIDLGINNYYTIASLVGCCVSTSRSSSITTRSLLFCGTSIGVFIFTNKHPSVYIALSPTEPDGSRKTPSITPTISPFPCLSSNLELRSTTLKLRPISLSSSNAHGYH